MSEEYKVLKEITASAIYDAGDKTSFCFRQQYQKFLVWADGHYKALGQDYFCFFIEMAISTLQAEFEKHPDWEAFLINKGFIEKVAPPKKFYCVTDEFRSNLIPHNRFKLVLVGRNEVDFVSLEREVFLVSHRLRIDDPERITEKEFSYITGGRGADYHKREDTK